jgi:hypothetical protein
MYKDYKQMTQEQIEEQDKKNTSILRKVNLWQAFKFVKHLTCQKDGCGCELVPKKQRTKVVLQCPNCRNVQAYVPKSVLTSKLKILDTSTGKFVDDVENLSGKNNGTNNNPKGSK